jgi:hypothetical protein
MTQTFYGPKCTNLISAKWKQALFHPSTFMGDIEKAKQRSALKLLSTDHKSELHKLRRKIEFQPRPNSG